MNPIEKAELSIIEQLSLERKEMQAAGEMPDWFITPGWQLFKEKYQWRGQTVKETYRRIAKTLAKHASTTPDWWEPGRTWEDAFFEVLWKGWLACSTPVLCNTGTDRGCPVSCAGSYVGDSISEFYRKQHEAAMLTKNGFGTASYLGDIRERGAPISSGGHASGVLPVIKDFIQLMRDVSQGNNRRGSWAGYLPIDHGDFFEVIEHVYNNPDDANIAFNYSADYINRCNEGDKDAIERFQKHMKLRSTQGKGYFFFPDKANAMRPQMYKDHGLDIKAPQLCNEIMLFSDALHTYTCVLSSMNVAKYNEWKDTDAIFVATVFLDCVCSEFLMLAEDIPGIEDAVRFTRKGRALGLGALGYHTYLQQEMIPFDGFQAYNFNQRFFKELNAKSLEASQWMAKEWGEPLWCEGYGVRNTHRLAVAPNTSSALLCGGVSQGIEPIVANVYTQNSAGGELDRMNPTLIELLKSKGKYTDEVVKQVAENQGSVKDLDFLTTQEKMVFATAYETDQKMVVRKANARQKDICQGQSLNLFFSADEDEEFITEVTCLAIHLPHVLGLYYQRGLAGVTASKGECKACEG